MGRPRKKGRQNWPDGLVARTKPAGTYYYFRQSDSQKEIPLGKDLKAAITGVKLALARRATDPVQAVINAIERPSSTVQQHFSWFITERLEKKKLSPTSLENETSRVNKLCRLLQPERAIEKVTSGIVNEALDKISDGSRNRYRMLAIEIFRSAVARSLIAANPADQTETAVAKQEKLRDRLSAEQYRKVYQLAAPWMQRAMEMQRLLLARPSDIAELERKNWDTKKNELRLAVGKTGVLLLIKPHAALKAALDACHAHQEADCGRLVAKPYLKRHLGQRTHLCEINEQILRDEFARLRAKAKLVAAPGKNLPTFYEIKSRGVDDYLELGWPISRIQSLIGHEDEEMTEEYAEGHRERWETVDLSAMVRQRKRKGKTHGQVPVPLD